MLLPYAHAGTACDERSADAEAVAPLSAALRALVAWLDTTGVPGMIIGGAAAALLGEPRVTGAVDALILVDEARWPGFLTAAAPFGLQPRVADALAFASRSRVFLMRHASSGIDVDVAVGSLPFEVEAVEARKRIDVAGISLPLPRPEDLIITNAVAHRARDIADIEAVVAAHPRLRVERMRRWLRAFADVLHRPEILDDVDKILSARKPTKPKARRRKTGKR
jgi:hypothetical protein